MEVRCERCRAQYVFADDQVTEHGLTVRCSNCGHLFKVKKKALVVTLPVSPEEASAQAPVSTAEAARAAAVQAAAQAVFAETGRKEWSLRQPGGQTYAFKDMSTLHRWIVERKAHREDEISRPGEPWRRLGAIPELQSFFAVVEAAERASQQPASQPTMVQYPAVQAPPLAAAPPAAPAPQAAPARAARPKTEIAFPTSPAATPPTELAFPAASAERGKTDPFAPAQAEPSEGKGRAGTAIAYPGAGTPPPAPPRQGIDPFAPPPAAHTDAAFPAPSGKNGASASPPPKSGNSEEAASPPTGSIPIAGTIGGFSRPAAPPAEPPGAAWERGAGSPAPTGQEPAWAAERTVATPPPEGRKTRRGTGVAVAAIVVLVTAGAGGAAAWWFLGRKKPAPPPAAEVPAAAAPVAPEAAKPAEPPRPAPEAQPAPAPPAPEASPPPPAPQQAATPPEGAAKPPAEVAGAPEVQAAPAPARAGEPAAAGPAPEGAAPAAEAARPPAPVAGEPPEKPAPAAKPAARPQPPRTARSLISQAKRLRDRGKAQQALDLFGQAVELEPRSAEAQAGRGWCYLELSQYAPAEASFQAALDLDGKSADALLGLAETFRYEGRRAEAVRYYERYLQAHPDGEDAPAAQNAIRSLKE